MGRAMLSGWLSAKDSPTAIAPEDVLVVGHTPESCERIREELGVEVTSNIENAGEYDTIVLAVKPQVFPEIMGGLAASIRNFNTKPLVLSIAAGITCASIASALPEGARIVRAMPNTPLQIGQGATAVAGSSSATTQDVETVQRLFNSLGCAVVVEESQLDAVTALSGAAPAYFASMVEALVSAGIRAGLPEDVACRLLVQSGLGTFQMMIDRNQSPEQTRLAVCSPGGTTLAALSAMDAAGFSEVMDDAVSAAINRAKELA